MAGQIRDYRDLRVWQLALALVGDSYVVARALPAEERFRLASQIRSAAESISANIAEGHGRPHRAEYRRFVGIAKGSAKELESHFYAATAVGYLTATQLAPLLEQTDHISRMLTTLYDRLAPNDVRDESRAPPPAPRS
jgi:four helix bundle protein